MISWAQELFSSSVINRTMRNSNYETPISGSSTPFTALQTSSNLSGRVAHRMNDSIIEAMQYENYLSAYPFGNKDVLLSILQFCDEKTLFILFIVSVSLNSNQQRNKSNSLLPQVLSCSDLRIQMQSHLESIRCKVSLKAKRMKNLVKTERIKQQEKSNKESEIFEQSRIAARMRAQKVKNKAHTFKNQSKHLSQTCNVLKWPFSTLFQSPAPNNLNQVSHTYPKTEPSITEKPKRFHESSFTIQLPLSEEDMNRQRQLRVKSAQQISKRLQQGLKQIKEAETLQNRNKQLQFKYPALNQEEVLQPIDRKYYITQSRNSGPPKLETEPKLRTLTLLRDIILMDIMTPETIELTKSVVRKIDEITFNSKFSSQIFRSRSASEGHDESNIPKMSLLSPFRFVQRKQADQKKKE